jgi:hypothetical protein
MVGVTAHKFHLAASGGALHLESDPRALATWSRCTLSPDGGEPRFLGADDIGIIAGRLLMNLAADQPPTTELAGRPVRWVLSLAEAHHSLFTYMDGLDRVLVWQDADGCRLRTGFRLSDAQFREWREQLAPHAAARLP